MEKQTGRSSKPSGTEAAATSSGWGQAVMLDLVLDELAYGVAVASAEGELLHANQAARREMARQRTLWLHNGRLRAHLPVDLQALQEALAKAAEGKRSLIHVGDADGNRLGLAVVPVRKPRGAETAHAALLFSRASVCESLMLCFFARSNALTSTEEHVLGILCQGYSAPEIARQLHVAVSTVRSHVRSLCTKTRSSGVRELVNRVAMLPPAAPALLYESVH